MTIATTDRHRPDGRRPTQGDCLLALALYGVAVAGLSMAGDLDPSGLVIMAPACAMSVWHRARPRTVVVLATLCTLALGVLGAEFTPLLMAPVLAAVYLLPQQAERRTAQVFSVTAVSLLLVTSLAFGTGGILGHERLGFVPWVLLAGAIGDAVRNRRDYVRAVEARAELAERTREEEARRRVGEERVRIARDLHDVIAHHIALAHAQAGTAAHLLHSNPGQAQRLLEHLTDTTSSALRELKATLGLLRRTDHPDAPLEPAPGLVQLPDLVTAFGKAGLRVTVSSRGTVQSLSPGADLTAYRVVQEALTNVAKHAGTGDAAVHLDYSRRHLTITVSDDGQPIEQADRTPGYGLIGMRERARSAGGQLLAGRRPQGGFEVTMELPLLNDSTGRRGAPEEESVTP
ncbi:sensor histidine kinase [Streptomyces sp. NBC_01317]|uniref:sensor histidine kinase n=1 Tax=Streptomyces sp. NBC_01317 TaxID=2903822 RepID=UPI002E122124|nr:sensor histidine kinase [Streptomyces sp. NBC_01317]